MPSYFLDKLNKAAARALKKIKEFMTNEPDLRRHVQQIMKEEIDNFLFVATGEGLLFKGMHYPDSAFSEHDFPVLFRGTDKNVIIAAWPQNYIREILKNVEKESPAASEKEWQKVLEEFLTAAVEVYKEGTVSDIL